MRSKWDQIHLFLPLLLFLTRCNASVTDDDDVGNANDYVDAALENLRKDPEVSKHLDPLDVPDYQKDTLTVKNVKVKGLLSLHRHGNCSLSYENETLKVIAEVAVQDVYITLDYRTKVMFFWINGDGIVSVDHLAVQLKFSSNDGYGRLDSFKVTNLGDYQVKKMTGLSFVLNWLLKLIANGAAQNARHIIINALENEAGKALDDLLRKHKLPL